MASIRENKRFVAWNDDIRAALDSADADIATISDKAVIDLTLLQQKTLLKTICKLLGIASAEGTIRDKILNSVEDRKTTRGEKNGER